LLQGRRINWEAGRFGDLFWIQWLAREEASKQCFEILWFLLIHEKLLSWLQLKVTCSKWESAGCLALAFWVFAESVS
jgi:hypothetical protein